MQNPAKTTTPGFNKIYSSIIFLNIISVFGQHKSIIHKFLTISTLTKISTHPDNILFQVQFFCNSCDFLSTGSRLS